MVEESWGSMLNQRWFNIEKLIFAHCVLCLAITQGSCVFNTREHRVSRNASVRKQYLSVWRSPRDDFGFLDWNIYFHKGCNYSNEANEMM